MIRKLIQHIAGYFHGSGPPEWYSEDLWPTNPDQKYIDKMKAPFSDKATFEKEYLGTFDHLPDYCVCRHPKRPLREGRYCRECHGKLQDVTVISLDNYNARYLPDDVPFKGRVIGDSSENAVWIQSYETGKQYELYEYQYEDNWGDRND